MGADSVAGASFADSPLVQQSYTFAAGFAWSWSLLQSDRLVPDPDR